MDKEKIRLLCQQYKDKELSVNKFTDALEKEGIPCWIGFTIVDLHRRVSYLSNVGKLSESERAIAEKWEAEHKERDEYFSRLARAEDSGSNEEFKKVLSEMPDIYPLCEHGRAIMGTCLSCDHIEKTLYPDMFGNELENDE